jgi:hypothetical protein
MKWQIDYAEDKGIVQVKTSGQMSWEDKKKLSEEALAAGRERNVNAFLVDQKEASLELSVLEIDRLPAMFKEIGFGPDDRMAILVKADSPHSSMFRFLQNVFTLRSLQIRVFTDPEKATAWLKSKT